MELGCPQPQISTKLVLVARESWFLSDTCISCRILSVRKLVECGEFSPLFQGDLSSSNACARSQSMTPFRCRFLGSVQLAIAPDKLTRPASNPLFILCNSGRQSAPFLIIPQPPPCKNSVPLPHHSSNTTPHLSPQKPLQDFPICS
jgi:hypothetical protein